MRFHEIRATLRGLGRAPAFALVTVATLAIGIGSTIAVGSFADALLLRPFPYESPEELVLIQSIDPTYGTDPVSPSVPDYLDFRERARSFSGMASFVTLAYNLPDDGGRPAIPLQVNFVTSEFFSLLGIEASLGRVFTRPEESPGEDLYSVVLSDALWRTRFGADPKVTRSDGSPRYPVPGGRMTTRIARKELKEMLRGGRFRWVDAVVFVLLAEKGARGHWEDQAGEPALGGRLLRFPDPTSSGGRRR
jgi:hypothetical protein